MVCLLFLSIFQVLFSLISVSDSINLVRFASSGVDFDSVCCSFLVLICLFILFLYIVSVGLFECSE